MLYRNIADDAIQLMDMGKEKGALYCGKVAILPSDVVSPEQVDDLMIMHEQVDREIVDGTQKVRKTNRTVHKIPEEIKNESEEKTEHHPFGKFSDPITTYMREVSSLSLLNRDEEVEVAKRIAEGENEVAEVVLDAPFVKEVHIRKKSVLWQG